MTFRNINGRYLWLGPEFRGLEYKLILMVRIIFQLDWRLSHEPLEEDCSEEQKDPVFRENVKCKVFLGFTSNIISSGVRETIRFLAEHKMVEH